MSVRGFSAAACAAAVAVICLFVGCVSDNHEAPPSTGQQSAAVQASTGSGITGTRTTNGLYRDLVGAFVGSNAFVGKCQTGTPPANANWRTCLSSKNDWTTKSGAATDLDGADGVAGDANAGCWIKNTCSDNLTTGLGGGSLTALYRRPRMATWGPFAVHEGALLSDAVSYLAQMAKANAAACPAGSHTSKCTSTITPPDSHWIDLQTFLANFLNYQMSTYYDPIMDRVLWVIEPIAWQSNPPDPAGRNWGIYIINSRPTSYQIIEVPHPGFDVDADRMGAEAFEKGDALALFIAGANRHALDNPTWANGTSTYSNPCGATDGLPANLGPGNLAQADPFDVRGKADPAHQNRHDPFCRSFEDSHYDSSGVGDGNTKVAFEWAHEGILSGLGFDPVTGTSWAPAPVRGTVSAAVIQFHGFRGDQGNGIVYGNHGFNVVVSPGHTSAGVPSTTIDLAGAVIGRVNGTKYPKNPSGWSGAGAALFPGGTVGGATYPLNSSGSWDLTQGAVEGKHNVQGIYAGSTGVGVPFLHIESDQTVRNVSTSDLSYSKDSCAQQPTGNNGGDSHCTANGPDSTYAWPSGDSRGTHACSPNLTHTVAREVTFAVDEWLAGYDRAILAPSVVSSASWSCPGVPEEGFDENFVPDLDNSSVPTQYNVPAYPKDVTMLAQKHHADLTFAGYQLESPYYLTKTSGSGALWTGHRDILQHAGWMLFPLYFAPINPSNPTPGQPDLDIAAPGVGVGAGNGTNDAANACSLASTEGFASGTRIFLDVETSDVIHPTGSGGASTSNTAVYIKNWLTYVVNSQSTYKAGVYCSTNNCDWIHQLALQVGIADANVYYWGHDYSCTSENVDACNNADCITTTPYSYPTGAGCTLPQWGDYYPANPSGYATAMQALSPATGLPDGQSGMSYFLWQIGGTNDDSGAGCVGSTPPSDFPGCIPSSSCTSPPVDDAGVNHGYRVGPMPSAQDGLNTNYFECRLAYVGDYDTYSDFVDVDTMNTGCVNGAPSFTLSDPTARHIWRGTNLTSKAQALYNYVTNPSQVSLSTTAQTMGVEPEIVTAFLAIYNAGGGKVVHHRVVANTVYAEQPSPDSPLLNGSFENTTLSGWTSTGTTANVGYQTAWSGARIGQVGATGPTLDSTLSQTLTIPPSGYGAISFAYQVHCPDTVTYDQFWVTLLDSTTNNSYTIVPQTCTNSGSWVWVDYDVTGLAGRSVTLTFHNHDDNYPSDPTYSWVDQVTLTPVENGGFERGSLGAWTGSGVTAAIQQSGMSAAYGTWGAQLGSTSASTDSTLSQTFTVPSFGIRTLGLAYKIVCPDTLYYDQVWATLTDNVTNTSYYVVPQTCTNTGTWSTTSFDLAQVAGHSVTLTLHNHDDNVPADPTYSQFDNIVLQ